MWSTSTIYLTLQKYCDSYYESQYSYKVQTSLITNSKYFLIFDNLTIETNHRPDVNLKRFDTLQKLLPLIFMVQIAAPSQGKQQYVFHVLPLT